MLILVDKKAPEAAKASLQNEGEVVEFSTTGICYEAISGHPDIFFFQHPKGLVVAPNTPVKYVNIMKDKGVSFTMGHLPVGSHYPHTAHYNALYTHRGILHNAGITDPKVKICHQNILQCKQGYVRCNAIEVGRWLLTSDKGIEHTMLKESRDVLYVSPQYIVLQGFKNGFLGGCCGIHQKKVYFCGSIDNIPQFDIIEKIIRDEGGEVIELYEGPLQDVGTILFLNTRSEQ